MAITKAGLRKAGAQIGIDLAGLFKDEEGEATGFEGLSPTLRIATQLKGRSPSTATYKAPYQPARTAEFELAPSTSDTINISNSLTAAPAPPMQTTPPPSLPKVEEPAAEAPDEFATRIAEAYQREFGREPLTQEVEDWRGTGLGIQEAERQLDVHPFRNFDEAVKEYYGVTMGREPVQSEIEDWRGTGYSLEKIKSDLVTTAEREKGGGAARTVNPLTGLPVASTQAPAAAPAAAPASDNFAQQVASFYRQSLGRTPAAKEISDWRGTGQNLSQIQSNLALIGARR